jgi:epoxide hydrolase 4
MWAMAGVDPASPARLALMLHGFPELHYSWRDQMPLFAARGYRVWAPNMRGYGASGKPHGVAAYRLDTLAADVAELIDLASAEAGRPVELTLIAHDWGALVAWHFAILALRPLARLIIMNVPHPKCSQREIRHWHQLRKSWYIFFFQLPWIPERALTRNRAAAIHRIFANDPLNKHRFPPAVRQIYADAALRTGAMRAMVNYYRALLRTGDVRAIGDGMVHVPTLMVWGENDLAIDLRCTDGTVEWVPDLELHTLPGVSHWVQQDAPDEVNAILTDWLDRRGG